MYVIGILHCHTVISRTEVVFPNRRIIRFVEFTATGCSYIFRLDLKRKENL